MICVGSQSRLTGKMCVSEILCKKGAPNVTNKLKNVQVPQCFFSFSLRHLMTL